MACQAALGQGGTHLLLLLLLLLLCCCCKIRVTSQLHENVPQKCISAKRLPNFKLLNEERI